MDLDQILKQVLANPPQPGEDERSYNKRMSNMPIPPEPVIGHRYRITMVVPGVWNVPRFMIADLLSMSPDIWMFNLRPLLGTQEIAPKYITDMVEVPKSTPVQEPRKL